MTDVEVELVFDCKKETVHELEYEIVSINYENTDGSNLRLNMRAFNKTYKLNLTKNNEVLIGQKTPIYLAYSDSKKNLSISYQKFEFPLMSSLNVYSDLINNAALMTNNDRGNDTHFTGVINDRVMLRPLPKRIDLDLLKNASFSIPRNLRENLYSCRTHHIAIKTKIRRGNSNRGAIRKSDESIQKLQLIERKRRTKREDSENQHFTDKDTVYPEILVVIDYETYGMENFNINGTLFYMIALWNAVDLKFREIDRPTVQLNIAGIVIPQDPKANWYLSQSYVGNYSILGSETLKIAGKYFSQLSEIPRTKYDVVVLMTRRDIISSDDNNNTSLATGIAAVGGACDVQSNVALVQDTGGFSGIITAAHELAHTFGAEHDGIPAENPTEMFCSGNDGYIMSYNNTDSRSWHWSNCSISSMRTFFNAGYSECLRNKPDIGIPYPKILPGTIMSRNEQCWKIKEGYFSNWTVESDCSKLHCTKVVLINDTIDLHMVEIHSPPADGTYCGIGHMCLEGKCVADTRSVYEPNPEYLKSKTLPGEVYVRDDQCLLHGDEYFSEEEYNCLHLICSKYIGDGRITSNEAFFHRPADGSYCGENQICFGGQCIKNIFDDVDSDVL
ncbi:hypothetical protein TKK_0012169 [Trichogramma kaykai]|uniref:Peptidase M12B domain-containing protein n=1 Tax=Trichogramma kaykai TaxID=54128 RepID=A0ABD2WP22_9HYME